VLGNILEIHHVWSVNYGTVQPRRLKRILPTQGHQGLAHEDDPGETEVHAHFPHGVGHIHVGSRADDAAVAPQGHLQPPATKPGGDFLSPVRVTGDDQRQKAIVVRLQTLMNLRRHVFLAGMGAGRQPDGATANSVLQDRQLDLVDGKRGAGEFQVADVLGRFCAQLAKSQRVGIGLPQAQIETAEQFSDHTAEPLPARK